MRTIPPAIKGPITWPIGLPRASAAKIRARIAIGYWSAISDGEIGIFAPAPIPVPALPIAN